MEYVADLGLGLIEGFVAGNGRLVGRYLGNWCVFRWWEFGRRVVPWRKFKRRGRLIVHRQGFVIFLVRERWRRRDVGRRIVVLCGRVDRRIGRGLFRCRLALATMPSLLQ